MKQFKDFIDEEANPEVASTYKKIAVQHLKDMMAKDSTKANKDYARKMHQRALEASKMSNHTDALNHYRGMKEEVEQVDELNRKTLASYVSKAAGSYGRDKQLIGRTSPDGTVKSADLDLKRAVKNRLTGINRAAERLAKEEVEIDESADSALAKKAEKSGVSLSILKKVYRRGVAAWNSGHRPGTTPQQWGMARVNSYITKGKGTYHGADKDLREEMVVFALEEAIDAIDQGEYDYEGAMSRTQLQTIMRSAKELIDTLRADENMPEWVQSKITKAEDYLSSVRDYMMSRKELGESESWEAGYKRRVVKTTDADHKEKGYNWRIKGKERPEISIKLYKEKPSQAEFNKQMKRVAGHEFGEETVSEDSRLKNDAYHKGLSDSTAKARVAHWKKMDKMSDRDPKSYQPAPGDATAKTKESKHTKKYHAMYGEEVEQIDEISQKLKSSYLEKSRDEVKQLKKHIKGEYSGIVKRMVARRQKGIKLASK